MTQPHPSLLPPAFGLPSGAEWLCILAFFGLAAGAVVVTIVLVSRRKAAPGGFPVAPVLPKHGPGGSPVAADVALPPHPGSHSVATAVGDPSGSPDLLPPGAVFLSYASQDRAAVQRVHDTLKSAGIDVWFDRRQLEAGDDYAIKIRRNIRACSLFVPVISANTQARREGFFRLEWRLAAERAMQIADNIPFILPVCLDETSETDALVPDRFSQIHWARLPDGKMTSEFATRIARLVHEHHEREQGQRVEHPARVFSKE